MSEYERKPLNYPTERDPVTGAYIVERRPSRLPESRPTPGSETTRFVRIPKPHDFTYARRQIGNRGWQLCPYPDFSVECSYMTNEEFPEVYEPVAAPASVGAGTPPQEPLCRRCGLPDVPNHEFGFRDHAFRAPDDCLTCDGRSFTSTGYSCTACNGSGKTAAPVPPRGAEPQEDKCPRCGSGLRTIRYGVALPSGNGVVSCSDSWHQPAAAPLGATEPPVGEGQQWKNAALRIGETLVTVGPPNYYNFTPTEWITWAIAALTPTRPAETPRQSQATTDVLAERQKQDRKWGEQNHDPFTYLTVLVEEVGEFAQAALHLRFGGNAADGFRKEAVQTAAVALAIVECIDRDKWTFRTDVDNSGMPLPETERPTP